MPTSSSDSEGTGQRTPRRRSTPRSATSPPATRSRRKAADDNVEIPAPVSDDDFGSGVSEEKAAREVKPARRTRSTSNVDSPPAAEEVPARRERKPRREVPEQPVAADAEKPETTRPETTRPETTKPNNEQNNETGDNETGDNEPRQRNRRQRNRRQRSTASAWNEHPTVWNVRSPTSNHRQECDILVPTSWTLAMTTPNLRLPVVDAAMHPMKPKVAIPATTSIAAASDDGGFNDGPAMDLAGRIRWRC
ncbi:MAG: hypothetical protein WKF77_05770 [Planctomycetaceae bacterium]